MLVKEIPGVVSTLAQPRLAIVEIGARSGNEPASSGDVQQVTRAANPLAVDHIELGRLKWRCDFVLDDLDLRAGAGLLRADFDGVASSDLEPHRRPEFERAAAGGGLRVAVH